MQSGPGIPATTPESGLEPTATEPAAAETGLGTPGPETGLDAPGAATGLDAPGAPGVGAMTGRPGRGVIEENDDLYEDYDSLYGGYGDYDYVEQGYLPNPSFGYGPRYRGYYTDDWYGDAAAFDDWYDSAPGGAGDALSPAP